MEYSGVGKNRLVHKRDFLKWRALCYLAGLTTLLVGASVWSAPASGPLTIEQARVVVTGFDTNRPDPFPGRGEFGWPGNIARLDDGSLMLVHSAGYYHASFAQPRLIEPSLRERYLAEGWPLDFPAPTGGRSMRCLSQDNGKTWGKPETLVDLPLDDGAYGLLRCQDGTLLCFMNVQASWYGYPEAPPGFRDDLGGLNSQQCVVRLTDEGATWSEPIWLESPGNFYERSHAQPIELPSGGILWPTYAISRGAPEFGVIHRSDDSGKTWQTIATIRREGIPVDEPAIARLNDGRLILICRPDGGIFYSEDEGVTWTESGRLVDEGTLKAPCLFVLEDGTVVCVATYGGLHVFLGKNGGQTWTEAIPLDRTSYGYPGGIRLEDDSILVSYCSSGRAPNRIYAVRFKVNTAHARIELLRP